MKVKDLIKELEQANPELEVYVWDAFSESYIEATFARVDELYKMDGDELIYDDEDEPVMFETFLITY